MFVQTSKMLSSCLTGRQPARWKSLMPSVATWLGLWARILPRQRSCTSLESPKLKVGWMHSQSAKSFWCCYSFWFLCGKITTLITFPQKCRPRCLTLTSFCPYTNTSARPRTAEHMRTLWRAWGYLTRKGTAQLWGLSSGMFWQPWVSWRVSRKAKFMKLSIRMPTELTVAIVSSPWQARSWGRTKWNSWCKTKKMLMVA